MLLPFPLEASLRKAMNTTVPAKVLVDVVLWIRAVVLAVRKRSWGE